ncbi:tetratricopeptide repeat protein [Candidatus Desantisbacteria bacterium]|nr:tetratricopeptide repeat protein [Candidatus Desantisbacteria bacterium]
MSLKKYRTMGNADEKSFFDFFKKNFKILIICGGFLFLLLIFIIGYSSYNEKIKDESLKIFEETIKPYHEILVKNDKKSLKEMTIRANGSFSKIKDDNIKTLSSLYMGNFSIDLNEFKDAIKYYEEFTKKSDDKFLHIITRLNQGLAYEELKLYPQALECFQKALQISEPNFLKNELNMAIARCYEKTGKIDQAKIIYKNLADSEEAKYRLKNLP